MCCSSPTTILTYLNMADNEAWLTKDTEVWEYILTEFISA